MNNDISTAAVVVIMVAVFLATGIISAAVTYRIKKHKSSSADNGENEGDSNGR